MYFILFRQRHRSVDISSHKLSHIIPSEMPLSSVLPLTIWLLAAALVIVVAVLLICALRGTPTLRTQPFRWLQCLAASVAIPEFLLLLILYTPAFLNKDGLLAVPAVCYVGLPLVPALFWLLILAVIMTSADRLCSLIKRNVASGFTETQAIVAMLGSILVSLILSFSITFGLGLILWHHASGDTNVCSLSSDTYSAIPILTICLAVVLVIQTILLSAFLIKVRAGEDATYPLDNMIPIIFGNLLLVTSLLVDAHSSYFGIHAVYLDALLLSSMMVVWLLADEEARKSFVQICCPCCRSSVYNEKTLLLYRSSKKWML